MISVQKAASSASREIAATAGDGASAGSIRVARRTETTPPLTLREHCMGHPIYSGAPRLDQPFIGSLHAAFKWTFRSGQSSFRIVPTPVASPRTAFTGFEMSRNRVSLPSTTLSLTTSTATVAVRFPAAIRTCPLSAT